MNSLNKTARIAGFLYLSFIVFSAIANAAGRTGIIVDGDAAATAANISAKGLLFRIGFVSDLLSALLFLLTAWALYALLKPVNGTLALSFLLLNLCGVAMQCFSMLLLYAALPLVSGGGYLAAFTQDQLNALALFFLGLYRAGFTAAQLFYGAWTLPLGYLVYKSGYLPRAIGILLMLDCLAELVWFFQFAFLPGHPALSYPGHAVSFLAEISLTAWLIAKGVKRDDLASGTPNAASPRGHSERVNNSTSVAASR
jgi:hypothetical protein